MLHTLSGIAGIPALLHSDGVRVWRAWLPGAPMQVARPAQAAYFRQALRLLRQMHRRGIAHNDLAKEPNWLVLDSGEPALIDFETAWCDPRRGWLFRALAREDLRHLLKHKRYYCPAQLTACQRRLLARPSALARGWGRVVRPLTRALVSGRRRPAGTLMPLPPS